MSVGLSVTIITLNEEKNIRRAIKSVSFANEVIIIDSGSSDQTVKIAQELGAKIFEQKWNGYGQQKNYAHDQASFPWILNIDADEEVPSELKEEILSLLSTEPTAHGYSIPRKTWHLGKWILHGGWYPNRLVRLARKEKSRWSEPQIHEALIVEGKTGQLKNDLLHYSFDGLRDQVTANLRYSHLGYLGQKSKQSNPSLFRLIWKPWSKFLETYFLKGGILDGIPGFIISVGAAYSVFLKFAYYYDPSEQSQ